jgi:hypothetical protein
MFAILFSTNVEDDHVVSDAGANEIDSSALMSFIADQVQTQDFAYRALRSTPLFEFHGGGIKGDMGNEPY